MDLDLLIQDLDRSHMCLSSIKFTYLDHMGFYSKDLH